MAFWSIQSNFFIKSNAYTVRNLLKCAGLQTVFFQSTVKIQTLLTAIINQLHYHMRTHISSLARIDKRIPINPNLSVCTHSLDKSSKIGRNSLQCMCHQSLSGIKSTNYQLHLVIVCLQIHIMHMYINPNQ